MSINLKIVDPEVELITDDDPVKKIEMAYRICYQSMDKMCQGSEALIKKCLYPDEGARHETPLEHVSINVDVPAIVALAIRQWREIREFKYIAVYSDGDHDNPDYACFGNLRAFFTFCDEVAFMFSPGAYPIETIAAARALYEALAVAFPAIFERKVWNDRITSMLKIGTESIHIKIDPYYYTFHVVTTRDVLQEFARHRQLSFNVESTRYCNYEKRGFTFVRPRPYDWAEKDTDPRFELWYHTLVTTAENYQSMLEQGAKAEEARMLLPGGLKTEFFVSGTELAWEHFCDLRCDRRAHPQMRFIAMQIAKALGIEDSYAE